MVTKIIGIKKTDKKFLIISYLLSLLITILVYNTGGVEKVYCNLMYIPIVVVSSIYGKKPGMVHAAFSAVLLGPMMPFNADLYLMQTPLNWILRLLIYLSISFIIGVFHERYMGYESDISYMLSHDDNTKLMNIRALEDIEKSDDSIKTVISLSVKNYNEIISVFGYSFTCRIVLRFSEMLGMLIKDFDDVHLYKDEGMNFIMIVKQSSNKLKTDNSVEKLIKTAEDFDKKSILVEDIAIYVEIVMGLSCTENKVNVLEALRQSRIAMEYAKSNDIRIAEYDPFLDAHYKDRIVIASGFMNQLNSRNIRVAKQNIYITGNNNIYGVELLARWTSDDGTQIFPNIFIPVIEKAQLINELTKYMVDNAIEFLMAESFKDKVVSMNFSSKDFNDDVIDYLLMKIQNSGIEKGKLQIEIAESCFEEDENVKSYVETLRKYGVLVAVDDFGKGYLSYQHISDRLIDLVKIDKSLIEEISDVEVSKDTVRSIVDVCKRHNIKTIAVGIEDKKTLDLCTEMGIDYMQGYYFDKPVIMKHDKTF